MFNVARSPSQRYESFGGLNTSFVADPLASSAYDDTLDPWSGTGTPAVQAEPASDFSNILGNAQIPPLYTQAFNAVDTLGSGTISVNALQRVVAASGVPATTIEQIVSTVTSSRSRVSRPEFYVAMALVGIAQQNQEPTLDAVTSLAQKNELPTPTAVDVAALQSSTIKSTFPPPIRGATGGGPPPSVPAPAYSSEPDPWSAASRGIWNAANGIPTAGGGVPATSSILSSGLPPQWWKGMDQVNVSIHGQHGLFFNRFMVYSVQSYSRGVTVLRRYSEFVFLWDCLVKRYPFRLLVQLPPKRIAADEGFIEQRRKGLIRFLNFVVNHPVLKDDGVLSAFLTEMDFEGWKKRSPISYDEEALTKRVDRVEEMSIPSNLEEKLAATRQKIGMLIEQWTRLCTLMERILKRREGAAADMSRATLTINALTESNHQDPWGGPTSELAIGVRLGMEHVSKHMGTMADTLDQRSRVAINSNLEALKVQRDLYVAVRDLFSRHDRFSPDAAERLRKRIETQSLKLENVKSAQKEGWEVEADKLLSSIEKDQQAVAVCLARRVFIRHCLWHEFRVVFHNREHTLLSMAVQTWATQERDSCESTLGVWNALVDSVQTMPYE
ncbi:hypothetical protein M408DRAFT_210488 [Serendipita vermifera MAFF 305830]|uniref:Sorting nexin MVP1 n=1 Tax=Serendipita vermifera MAFF 305830 TaxID=933852 RepID=A0A0C3ALD8_SERVB|nr:hypothetical protein M408DRAFT_210488 [Serendipita vermifera MAFF 305830]